LTFYFLKDATVVGGNLLQSFETPLRQCFAKSVRVDLDSVVL